MRVLDPGLQFWTLGPVLDPGSSSLHQCCPPPMDLKCAARPTIDPGGGRISPAVGGSTRLRSFWLCYAREAILESCLLCSSGTVGTTCVQTFVVNFCRSERDVDDPRVRSHGPLRFCASGRWRKLAQIFFPSLDYPNNNIHGL